MIFSPRISLANSCGCEWPPAPHSPPPPGPGHPGSLVASAATGGHGDKWAPRWGWGSAGELHVPACSTNPEPALLPQSSSSCHGELHSKVGAPAPLFPGRVKIWQSFCSCSLWCLPSTKLMLSWTRVWCCLLILKTHEDKLISFLPNFLHLKKWRWRVEQSAN